VRGGQRGRARAARESGSKVVARRQLWGLDRGPTRLIFCRNPLLDEERKGSAPSCSPPAPCAERSEIGLAVGPALKRYKVTQSEVTPNSSPLAGDW
jgi:hypothetical protein